MKRWESTEKWDPNFGQLAIREIWQDDFISFTELFCIKDANVKPFPHSIDIISLIEYRFPHTYLLYGCYAKDFIRSSEEQITTTRRVVRREASSDDIHNLFKIWDKSERLWPDEWVVHIRKKFVEEKKLLSIAEFQRLQEIALQYIAIPNPLNKYKES